MASETKPTVLDLWVCPSCGDHSHFDRWHPDSPRCSGHIPPVAMVRRHLLDIATAHGLLVSNPILRGRARHEVTPRGRALHAAGGDLARFLAAWQPELVGVA